MYARPVYLMITRVAAPHVQDRQVPSLVAPLPLSPHDSVVTLITRPADDGGSSSGIHR